MSSSKKNDRPKIPINRVNKFFDEDDFNLEVEMGREYVEGDLNFSVVLYRIDKKESAVDDLYGEVNPEEIQFKPPVELKVILDLENSEPKTYAEGRHHFEDYGKLTFHVYTDQLEEKEVDISYGDIIAYNDSEDNVALFEVVDPNKIFSDNEKTILGYRGFYRSIVCVHADESEYKLI